MFNLSHDDDFFLELISKENEKSLSSVHVEYIKRDNREVSRRVRAMTA